MKNKLGFFEKCLGRLFIADCKVELSTSNEGVLYINIQITSYFSLPEAISLLLMPNSKNNGLLNFSQNLYCFQKMYRRLTNSLKMPVEIQEIAIYLQNTDVIIHKTHENCILKEIQEIFSNLIGHFEHYSNTKGEIPFEIHIPVLENPCATTCDKAPAMLKTAPSLESPYLTYWGFYFNSLRTPVIYDLKSTLFIRGDLDLMD